MTDSPPDGHAQIWKETRAIAKDVAELKTWRAATEAVATWRRWVLPLAIGVTFTVINLLLRH